MTLFRITLASAALMMMTGIAQAEPDQGMMGREYKPVQNRQEAIARAKEHVSKLEKMSDDEWNKQHKERMARHEAFKKMTPEQRKELRERMREHRGGTAPAAGAKPGATPATPPKQQ